MTVPLSQEFHFLPKTGRPASFGTPDGPFPFFTSSQEVSRSTDSADCTGPALVFGTGGAASIHYVEGPFSATNDCYVAVPKSGKAIDAKFFYRFLRINIHLIESGFRGAGLRHVSKKYLEAIPLPTDKRIDRERVNAILDKADAIRRKREQALGLADDFLRSVFLEMFGRPKQPNPALRTRPLGEICGLFAGNSLPSGESFSGQTGGHLLLKVGDLNLPGNDQTVINAREWLSEKARTGAAIVAPKDAIVFPKRGGAIATNKKRVLGRPCILDPNLMAVAPKTNSPVSYPFLRAWFELLDLSSISNGSTVPQLNKGDLYPLEIPIPDKEDLFAFDRVFHGVNRIRAKHADDLMSAEALFSSLSQRAFRGEL